MISRCEDVDLKALSEQEGVQDNRGDGEEDNK